MFLTCFNLVLGAILSSLSAFGMSIVLVEKQHDWPASWIRPYIIRFLSSISSNLPSMLECTVCTSFWTALLFDIIIFIISGCRYFSWPISGFVAIFISWFAIELLNALDRGEKHEQP